MNSVFSFYRKIYEQELNQSKRLHLQSSRISKQYFLFDKEELLNNIFPKIPISEKQGEEIFVELELRGKEVELVYFSMLRISKFVSLNKFETVRAYPLFMYKASLSFSENGCFVSIDTESREVLRANLPTSVLVNPSFKKLDLLEEVNLHFTSLLKDSIDEVEKEAYTDELLMYPELYSKKAINKIQKQAFKEGDEYYPTGVLAIVEKEKESYSTLSELAELEKTKKFSSPLKVLFNKSTNFSEEKMGILCEELNRSQLEAVNNSNDRIVSMISGPPGTGKSFTIANLAAEKVSKGQSVLITSKNQEALEVIESKIAEQLGIKNLCINPSKDRSFVGLTRFMDELLSNKNRPGTREFDEIEAKYTRFQKIHDNHIQFERDFIKSLELEKEFMGGYLEEGFTSKFSDTYKERIIASRGKITVPLWDKLQTYYKGIEAQRKYAIHLVKEVNKYIRDVSVKDNRMDLRNFQSFLKARNNLTKAEREKKVDFETILKAFPVWLVKANEVSRTISLRKEIFDVLIIDEASQCDIPSLLPLLQRAKKCVVVGDAQQLIHISFISKAFELLSKKDVEEELKHLCQHRDYSMLDLVSDVIDPSSASLLNEHFRSKFPIISFSNQAFYNSDLDIMTKRPITTNRHVEIVKKKGKRIKKRNLTEVKAIVSQIRKIIKSETELGKQLKSTIGVLSPFRGQVDALFDAIRNEFTSKEIKDHEIVVGTAFSFQGDEKDVMLLSFALDNNSVSGSFNFLNRKDVFNVSITRAKNTQFIYHSFDKNRLNPDSTVAAFFRHYDLGFSDLNGEDTKDAFCIEVEKELEKKGYKTWKKFSHSGISMDLLLEKNGDYAGIDLIGFPGEMEDYYSLERYKMIERGNIRLFPLPYPLWRYDKTKCLEAFDKLLN